MSEERSQFAQRIDERKFSLSRRGYDKREVRDYLEDLEQAFREVEGHAKRTSQRVGELERDLSKARATERVSVDNAMMAVFDAKDRILERARRRADEIEEEAHAEAGRIKAAALTGAGGVDGAEVGELAAARAQADEIVAAARREADRLRLDAQNDAAEDLEAELAATTAQLRRAYDDTSSAREELDAARRRIVASSSSAPEKSSNWKAPPMAPRPPVSNRNSLNSNPTSVQLARRSRVSKRTLPPATSRSPRCRKRYRPQSKLWTRASRT